MAKRKAAKRKPAKPAAKSAKGLSTNGTARQGGRQPLPKFLSRTKHPKKRAFLQTYAETFNIVQTCRLTGVPRGTHYYWLYNDPDYAVSFREAGEVGADSLEAELVRRAKEGVRQYKFHNGKPQLIRCEPDHPEATKVEKDGRVIHVRHYYEQQFSDTLGIFLMKGAKPEKYRERYEVREEWDDEDLDKEIEAELEILAPREKGRVSRASAAAKPNGKAK